jgi:type I restriction enzyme M protein
MVPVADIEAKDFDLSINRYKETKHEAVSYDPPKKIIAKLRKLEAEIAKDLSELEAML